MSPAQRVPRDAAAPGVLRWGMCLALVVGVHMGLAVLLLRRAPVAVVPPPVPEAVMMDLAPATAAPKGAPPQPASQVESAPAPARPSLEPPLPPQPVPEPPRPPPPAPVPQAQTPAPAPPSLPEPPVAMPPPPPRQAAPGPLPQASRPPPPPSARPTPRRSPPPRAVTRQPPRPTQDEALAPASAVPARNSQAAPPVAAPAVSPAPVAAAAPASSAVPGWRGELIGRLQRAKRYPDVARERDEQGVATVTFTMDRNGHVLSATLVHSSGSQALDEEAVAMVHRAEPLPPMPAELAGNTVKLTLPVTFSLR